MNLLTFVLALLVSFRSALPWQQQAAPAAQEGLALSAERHELADIRVLVGAERAYTKAKERLAALKKTLASRTDADAKALLVEVESLDQSVRRALGEAVPAALGGQDKVDEAVLAAIQREDFAFVRQLGKRAVPGLLRAVRSDLDVFSSWDKDPLWVLTQIDPLATSQLAGELLGESGFFWKKRVTRIFGGFNLSGHDDLWSAGSPQRWLGEGLSKTAEKYAEDPDVGVTALRFLLDLASRGERATTLDAALARALRSSDPARRGAAKELSMNGWETLGSGVFRALLEESDADLRDHAAEVLADKFPQDRSLLEHVTGPDPSVRFSVAALLLQSDGRDWQDAERAALATLLTDPVDSVRQKARKVLGGMETRVETWPLSAQETNSRAAARIKRSVYHAPLEPAVYRALLKGNAQERSELCAIALKLPTPLCFELLEALAADRDLEVLRSVKAHLQAVPALDDPPAALRLASALLDGPLAEENSEILRFVSQLLATPAGLDAMLRWVLARSDDAVFEELVASQEANGFENVLRLEPELAIDSLTRLYRLRAFTVRTVLEQDSAPWTPALARACRGLAADETQPLELRVLALRGALQKTPPDDEVRKIASGLLAHPGWRDWESAAAAAGALDRLLEQRPHALANALILQVQKDPAIAPAVAAEISDRFVLYDAGVEEIVKLVLARGLDDDLWYRAVRQVLIAMGSVPALMEPAVLTQAARSRLHSGLAFETIQMLGDVRYLPFLTECVAQPSSAQELELAVQALCGYLDEAAVEPLLAAAAKVQRPHLRDQCLAHLEKIREYEDSKERWATRKVRAQTREQVIAELVAQLAAKSDEIKVQAIRALATWEAVEAMPRLIELSASGSKSVAAAARAALDRLNAPKGE